MTTSKRFMPFSPISHLICIWEKLWAGGKLGRCIQKLRQYCCFLLLFLAVDGGILQEFLHPVSYFSRKFDRHQCVYSMIKKEALAFVQALKHFKVYVGSVSAPTIIFIGHNPLAFINQIWNTNLRFMRWALFLQSFNVEVRHAHGKEKVPADTLQWGYVCIIFKCAHTFTVLG